MNIYIYTNLPVNAIVRLPHSRSGDSQGQETFSAPSTGKQTRNYDTRVHYIYISSTFTSKIHLINSSMNFAKRLLDFRCHRHRRK